jgi:tetratricopeptide (TPR) repeat protein
MTTRATRLAFASILALSAIAEEATAQARRPGGGGMVGNRGNIGNINRPNINPQQFNNVNRQNLNVQNVNRQNIGNNTNIGNRTNIANTSNRTNIVNNNTTIINSRPNVNGNVNRNYGYLNPGGVNNINRGYGGGFGGYGGYGGYRPGYSNWGGYGGYHGNSYYGYHQNWVHGSWNGNYGPRWGGYNVGNSALGIGAAVGIAAWGVGSLINSWGYSRYSNPYYGSSAVYAQQPVASVSPYDYSRPLDFASAPPAEAVIQTASSSFDAARQAFQAGDYPRALTLADQALTQTPNDPILHEFRAICLFAQRRYDEAAVPLYTVLSAGPGFDWTTLIGLYPNVETYTAQLRALEAYCNESPRAASARFVLAAIYLTQGSTASAAARLKEVVALQPQDRLSAQLLSALEGSPSAPGQPATPPAQPTELPAQPTAVATASEPAEAPPLPTGPVSANLLGVWTARPVPDVAIALTLGPDKAFAWKVTEKGQSREFKGEAGLDNDVLALVPPDMPPMVGKLTRKDAAHFHFKALGTPSDDPGLDFGR